MARAVLRITSVFVSKLALSEHEHRHIYTLTLSRGGSWSIVKFLRYTASEYLP